jgi:hypothetical protein
MAVVLIPEQQPSFFAYPPTRPMLASGFFLGHYSTAVTDSATRSPAGWTARINSRDTHYSEQLCKHDTHSNSQIEMHCFEHDKLAARHISAATLLQLEFIRHSGPSPTLTLIRHTLSALQCCAILHSQVLCIRLQPTGTGTGQLFVWMLYQCFLGRKWLLIPADALGCENNGIQVSTAPLLVVATHPPLLLR